MNFKQKYPDYAAIEDLVLAARVERAIYVSEAIIGGLSRVVATAKRLAAFVASQLDAERNRRADAFLKRSAPKY
jgi:hypothetical protein